MKLNILASCLLFLFWFSSCKKIAGPKGDAGIDGYTSLIKITPFASNSSCINGGLLVQSGIDKNRNNILDSMEIDNTESVCNGAVTGGDKQIFMPIEGSGSNTTSTTPVITGSLVKFSKTNFVGVDSIILVADPYVGDPSNSSIVNLYDITDGQVISGSTLTSNNTANNKFIQTGNVYKNLPDKEITLGISQSSLKDGFFAGSGSCYLFLYRR